MSDPIQKLTDEDRSELAEIHEGCEALRIIDALTAENERLRVHVFSLDCAHRAAASRLAAATALLRDHQHLATVHYTNAGCALAHRTEAFLANQPASGGQS